MSELFNILFQFVISFELLYLMFLLCHNLMNSFSKNRCVNLFIIRNLK